jgi:hypothetical protein
VAYTTKFGSLGQYEKGTIEIIDDDPRRYAFSNIFEVAAHAKPYEKIAVGKNMQYVLEAIRADGTSGWRTCAHDEFALVMLTTPAVDANKGGSVALPGEPIGPKMGRVVGGQGHMILLPANAAYQFHAAEPSVILLQTIKGDDTIERWAEICLS